MSTSDLIEAFWRARQQGVHFPPAYYGKLAIDDAYAIQLGLIARRAAGGERQIGWKVGLTAKPIQQQFGSTNRSSAACWTAKPPATRSAPAS